MNITPTMRYVLQRGAMALCIALPALQPSTASAHAVAGKRFFVSTLSVDDPGVGDEVNVEFGHSKSLTDDGARQNTNVTSIEWDKLITPRLAASITASYINLNAPDGGSARGFDNYVLGLKYTFYVNEAHEFMASAGVFTELGGTGAKSIANPHSTVSPRLFAGKGLGDLPDSLKYLKPFAITGEIGPNLTTHRADPNAFSWGATVQYSLPYLQAFVQDVGLKAPFSNLVPVVEFPMETCTGGPCSGHTTGTINPGIVWLNRYGQLGIEAQIPINRASGTGVGVVLQAHLFLDDIAPNSIGRPLFGGGR